VQDKDSCIVCRPGLSTACLSKTILCRAIRAACKLRTNCNTVLGYVITQAKAEAYVDDINCKLYSPVYSAHGGNLYGLNETREQL